MRRQPAWPGCAPSAGPGDAASLHEPSSTSSGLADRTGCTSAGWCTPSQIAGRPCWPSAAQPAGCTDQPGSTRSCAPVSSRPASPACAWATLGPIASELLPEHTAPELLYLESKWASLVSYGLTVTAFRDFLPVDAALNAMSVRRDTLRVARRL